MKNNIVELRITNQCNNNCMFCLEQSLRREKEISNKEIELLIKNGYKNNENNELLIRGGNAILNKKLINFITLSREIGYSKVRIIFNGNFQNSSISRSELLSSGLTDVTLLLHSHISPVHNFLTQNNESFNELSISLKQFLGKLNVKICVYVNGANIDHLKTITKKIINIGVKSIDYLNFLPVERGYEKYKDKLLYNIGSKQKVFKEVFRILKDNSIMSWWNRFPEYIFEDYEHLIPAKDNILKEITGDEYQMFEKCLSKRVKPECHGRCTNCFLNSFCCQLSNNENAVEEYSNLPICLGGDGVYSNKNTLHSKGGLKQFFDMYLKELYRVKSYRCGNCKFSNKCDGLHIDQVIKKGFKVLKPLENNKICVTKAFDVELTDACNLHCIVCRRKKEHKTAFMSLETFKSVLNFTKKGVYEEIFLSGHGDIFLHKDLLKFLDYLFVFRPDLKVIIPTKGQSIKDEHLSHIKKLKEKGQNITLCFSVFSLKKEIYEKMTGDSYERFWKTIKKANKYKLSYVFDFLISSYSFEELDLFRQKASELKKNFDFSVVYNWNGKISKNDFEKFLNSKIKNKLKKRNSEKCEVFLGDYIFVDAKGNIYPCTLDVDKNGLLGNVMIDSFQDVIKKRNKIEYHKFCKECFNYKYKNLEI